MTVVGQPLGRIPDRAVRRPRTTQHVVLVAMLTAGVTHLLWRWLVATSGGDLAAQDAWAEFARADTFGRETVMKWQTAHRRDSPYPLRHNGSNAHIVDQRDDEATFASYIHVTQVMNESPVNIPGGTVTGTVRREGDMLRIAEFNVVLDTMTSDVFSTVKA